MSEWRHWPEDIRGKQEAYRQSVWTFAQWPLPYLLIMILGTWISSWAIFKWLNYFGPYSSTKGFGDILVAIFVTYFPGIFISALITGAVFMLVALPVSYFSGRDLIFGSAKNTLAINDDNGAAAAVALPIVVGNIVGFILWIFDLNPLAFLPWG